jgi:hypothetical protein
VSAKIIQEARDLVEESTALQELFQTFARMTQDHLDMANAVLRKSQMQAKELTKALEIIRGKPAGKKQPSPPYGNIYIHKQWPAHRRTQSV